MTLLMLLKPSLVCCFPISLFFTPKPTTLSFFLCLSLASCCHSFKTHSVCGCNVPRTSTPCVWLFSQDENTDDCMLGCQPLFSSLFVFLFHVFSSSHLFFLVSFFTLFPTHTQQHLMPLLTLSMLSNDLFFNMFFFFFTIKLCGLLPEYQLAVCHPHSLKRERWGRSRYGLMPGRVE